MTAIPKPKPKRLERAKRKRVESKVIQKVRGECVVRDGECRIGDWERNPEDYHDDGLNDVYCEGESEWAHLEDKRRFKTRGQSAEQRHTTAYTAMLCKRHHDLYDDRQIQLQFTTFDGANGPLKWTLV